MDFDTFTTPGNPSGTLRQILERHLTSLVASNNALVWAKLEYLDTGTVSTNPDISGWVPYVGQEKPAWLVKRLRQSLIELGNLEALEDPAFVKVYNETLLKLRTIHLPDPMPS